MTHIVQLGSKFKISQKVIACLLNIFHFAQD
jgi:hypothetical protein